MRMAQTRHQPSSRSIEGHGDVDAVIDQNVIISANAVLKVHACSLGCGCAQQQLLPPVFGRPYSGSHELV